MANVTLLRVRRERESPRVTREERGWRPLLQNQTVRKTPPVSTERITIQTKSIRWSNHQPSWFGYFAETIRLVLVFNVLIGCGFGVYQPIKTVPMLGPRDAPPNEHADTGSGTKSHATLDHLGHPLLPPLVVGSARKQSGEICE